MKPGIDNPEWCAAMDKRLDDLMAAFKRLEAKLSQSTSSGGAAPDVDLDGPHGDPVVRKDPKRWDISMGSYVGCHFSECPTEYLEAVASFKDWQAGMDERKGTDDDKRKAKFNRLDAARARGWAQRLRSGYKAPEKSTTDDDSVPF